MHTELARYPLQLLEEGEPVVLPQHVLSQIDYETLTLTEIDPPLLNKADPPAFREATID